MILKKIYGFSADETRGHTTVSSNLPIENKRENEKRRGCLKKIFKDLVETDEKIKKLF